MDFLVVDDDKAFREATCALIEDEGHYAEGANSGSQAMATLRQERFDAVLLDLKLGTEDGLDTLAEILRTRPRLPVVMFTAVASVKTAVEAMRRGAMDFLEKPFHREQFQMVLARLQHLHRWGEQIERLEREVRETREQNAEPIFDFTTPAAREVMEVLLRAAPTPASVLILGESGTGKGIAARAVHQHSHLADKPFVTVSCPSLSKELLESELFGHVKGSFTGAIRDHWGKVKAAEGGTLFLDEIGDLPMEIQPKLLRLLQEREYERLGENVTRRANVRVVAATNRDLKKRVVEGAFRDDLFFRLNVIAVEMPPLRRRPDDLIRFAEHYARHFALQCGRTVTGFTEDAVASLRHYAWPGNLREMRNAIERAVILARGDQLTSSDLPAEMRIENLAAEHPEAAVGAPLTIEKLEALHIRRVLERVPNFAEASAILGIDQATLYRKRKRLGLD
jgi:NtrC-family two-component system response regulator AlgB